VDHQSAGRWISIRAPLKTASWLSREELATNVRDTWDELRLHQLRERIEDSPRDKDVTDESNVFAVRLIGESEMVAAVVIADFLPVLADAGKALEQAGRGDLAESLERFVAAMEKRARNASIS
jgi:hypothetical protein